MLSFYVSLCSEFRVAHFFSLFCVVLLCIFMFCVHVAHFFSFLCCPVMYLYVLSSVLLISLVFFVLSCYVSLCSEFRVAYFIKKKLCCPVMCLYVLSSVLLISLVCFLLSCYVSLCSEFRVAHFFSLFCVVLLCIFMF